MKLRLATMWVFIMLAVHSGAQTGSDTVLRGATIEVIQSYKPQVKQAPKPQWLPQLPPPDTTRPKFKYDVPAQTIYYTYSSMPLRPLALGIDSGIAPFKNYAAAGAGNLSTLYLDAGIGGLYGMGYETAFHMHHISQQGDIKYQQTALSGIEAEGMIHKEKNDWHVAVNAERNEYYYYAYPDNEPASDLKQVYTTLNANADFKNKDSAGSVINYHPAVSATSYTGHFGTSETTLGINAPFTYDFDTALQGIIALKGALTHFSSNGGGSASNNYIELLPGINFHQSTIYGHALLGLATGKNNDGYILPDLYAALPIAHTPLQADGGWLATLRQNTYQEITTENPYLAPYYNVLQTRKDEVFAGIKGSYGHHLFYSGRVSWNSWNDLPTYLNYYAYPTGQMLGKQYYTTYQDVKAAGLRLTARYQVADIWSAGITGNFYDFYQSSDAHVWETPATKITGDFMIHPLAKLTVTAYLASSGGIYAENVTGQSVKLKSYTDLGGNAEYQIIPRLSAFIQVSNLLNEKYQRWMGYEAYGINIYGGIRLKF